MSFGEGGRLSQTWQGLIVPHQGEATYYMRISRLYNGPFRWPPPTLSGLDVPEISVPPAPALPRR